MPRPRIGWRSSASEMLFVDKTLSYDNFAQDFVRLCPEIQTHTDPGKLHRTRGNVQTPW
jgi:hypothetical protein